ncbi:MAG: hypothetical protein DKT66_16720 [Candidatus Melainabacteria bacterium]|nr:MAG: hypothetical protein DKT66_16720 [Candidatus Melainabacteria bacterium]
MMASLKLTTAIPRKTDFKERSMHKRDVNLVRIWKRSVFAMTLSGTLVAATGAMAFEQHKHQP